MKRSNTYLIFDGNCAQAMKFYARCLGAELHLMPYSEMPGEVSKAAKDRIMHAKLTKGDMTWMASDNHPDHTAVPFKQGNNFLINLDCESAQEIAPCIFPCRNTRTPMPSSRTWNTALPFPWELG